jgi:hypothetical protein
MTFVLTSKCTAIKTLMRINAVVHANHNSKLWFTPAAKQREVSKDSLYPENLDLKGKEYESGTELLESRSPMTTPRPPVPWARQRTVGYDFGARPSLQGI